MKLSIVATLYKSTSYINEFCQRAGSAAQALVGDEYEIILVNDGSPDDSLSVAQGVADSNEKVCVVDLSKNFGHHKAMMTGLSLAKGERVFLIDSDLEEDPEWLTLFAECMATHRCDVVYGVQGTRKGGWVERLTGNIFYRAFRLLTGISQPDNIVTARLMTAQYVAALLRHEERELNIGGLWILTGFDQRPLMVAKKASSPTTYSLRSKLGHLVNAVTSFSSLPLVFTFYVGAAISFTAACFILYLLFRYFIGSAPPTGYTSVVASIWFFSGLIIFFIGVQGIYISKIFTEVKKRPYTIIKSIYKKAD
ncbi:glycosyl transferase [Pseudomonas sp. S25]|uniref:Glycosyl transferase n=1 Tax=Pseudomonas maioricensis TaxID=1766623 RepID=A0ABS9ZJJ7_9PSED|nr:glycosyltransferase family 2 protein [Pseudomonas sp. S25]MCI8210397.1 glycosyl transferase [Pseudomonas sp. S25]